MYNVGKQIHKPTMTKNGLFGKHPIYKIGDYCGIVYDIVYPY